ncbi:MAG TPA: hypothetical protein VJU60_11665 [Thermoleophilaceae bacterium]|nr:hypothetical protein [Thermoleophilaceae bacterium]
MTTLPSISAHERYWNAEVARRRPDLVSEEKGPLHRMIERYAELSGSAYGAVAHVLTDRARVLRHLIDVASEEAAGEHAAVEAGRHLTEQVGSDGAWTESQAERLAALIESHPGAKPEIMPTGDGAIVISFGPRRGNGAYVLDPQGRSRWVTTQRYAA